MFSDPLFVRPREGRMIAGVCQGIADHFGAVMVEAGKLVGCTYAAYPNVTRWLDRMRALPSWNKVHEAFYGFAGSLKGKSFVSC